MKKLILKYQDKIFPILDIALNGINYFFHIFCSWYLTQSNYGILNSILSILAILLVTGIAFQTFTAKEVAKGREDVHLIYQSGLSYIFVILVIYSLGFKKLLDISKASSFSLCLLATVFIFNLFLSIIRGILQGRKEFLKLNLSFYIEVFSKVIFLFVLLPFHRDINIILGSLLFGMTMSLIHGGIELSVRSIGIRNKGSIMPTLRGVMMVFISNFFIYYFTSIDMIVVNYLYGDISGIYAVVLRYSQIMLFVSFSIMTVFLPKLSNISDDIGKFNRRSKVYFGILLGLQLCMLVGYIAILPMTVELLFGPKYLEASKFLFKGACMYIFLVDSFYLVNVNIILERRKYIYILSSTAIVLTYVLLKFSIGIEGVINLGTISYGIMLLLLGILCLKENQTYEKTKY